MTSNPRIPIHLLISPFRERAEYLTRAIAVETEALAEIRSRRRKLLDELSSISRRKTNKQYHNWTPEDRRTFLSLYNERLYKTGEICAFMNITLNQYYSLYSILRHKLRKRKPRT